VTGAVHLEVSRLSKRFGHTLAVDDASFNVRAGEFVALLGPSGSGKSTVFRCISRLVRAEAGEITIAGQPITALTGRGLRNARRELGLVFQQFNLIGRLSAIDNVLLGRIGTAPLWRVVARRFDTADRQLALEALDSVGLLARAYQRADSLSGGQQQRVAIARVLAQRCRIILADEPVASLDPAASKNVLETLGRTARERGVAVLCSLHQVELAVRYADRIIAMDHGRIVFDQAPGSIEPGALQQLYRTDADTDDLSARQVEVR
jgi:phosphonate transport system ATP-binding protein